MGMACIIGVPYHSIKLLFIKITYSLMQLSPVMLTCHVISLKRKILMLMGVILFYSILIAKKLICCYLWPIYDIIKTSNFDIL